MIPTILTSLIIGIVVLTVFGFQEAESTTVVIVDFGDGTIDTSGGRVCGAAVDAYLAGFGITAIDSGSGGRITDFCIWQFDRSTGVHAIASSLPNGFFRNFGNEAYSYSLNFATPLDSFQFTRTSYDTSFGGIISEAWNAQAFDSVGNSLGLVGERLQSRFGFSAPIQFSFIGPDIAKVTFFRNTVNTFAGIAQVPLDDLILTIPIRVIEVTIDIKPGSDPSSVSCKNTKGNVPVAIFGSEDFDVSTIDLDSLQLNGVDVIEVHDKIHIEDKNGDEFPDAVLHLDSAGVCEATSDESDYPLRESADVTLTGSTTEDPPRQFEGIGDIRIVKR